MSLKPLKKIWTSSKKIVPIPLGGRGNFSKIPYKQKKFF